MTEALLVYAVALCWGLLLGLLYFGGLWLTVKRLPVVKHQALWTLGSFLLRNLLAAAAFYPVVMRGWEATVVCLTGFIIVRMLMSRRIKDHIRSEDRG